MINGDKVHKSKSRDAERKKIKKDSRSKIEKCKMKSRVQSESRVIMIRLRGKLNLLHLLLFLLLYFR